MEEREIIIDDILLWLQASISDVSIGRHVSFYFIYNLPRQQSYSYLLSSATFKHNLQEESISFQAILKDKDPEKEVNKKKKKIARFKDIIKDFDNHEETILTIENAGGVLEDAELAVIISSALINNDIRTLIDSLGNYKLFENRNTYHSRLESILSLFNKLDEANFIEHKWSTEFPTLVRIALLSFQQLPSDYSIFSDPSMFKSDGDIIKGEIKLSRFYYHIKEFNRIKREMLFADRLFLLVTLTEGFLWNLIPREENDEKQYSIGDFYVGNLYDFLQKGNVTDKLTIDMIQSNLFFLKPIVFYFYGELKESKDSIKLELQNKFVEYLAYIIQFSKFFIAQNNYSAARYLKELVSPYWTKTIANGITSVLMPSKITIQHETQGNYVYSFERDESSFKSVEILRGPWALYKETQNPTKSFERMGNSIEKIGSDKLIKIQTYNSLNETINIILDFNWENKKDVNWKDKEKTIIMEESEHFLKEFDHYQYSLKSLIEKLMYINNNVNINIDIYNWYNKAFCNLYVTFDRYRHRLLGNAESTIDTVKEINDSIKKYEDAGIKNPNTLFDDIRHVIERANHQKYRLWEERYFKSLFENKKDITLIDAGIGYGRLESKLFSINPDVRIIGVDSSNYLLDELRRNLFVKGIEIVNGKRGPILKRSTDKNNTAIELFNCDFRNMDCVGVGTADIVCFVFTTFGYFREKGDNKEVLEKAYKLLKPNGILIIEQFNPLQPPMHCNRDSEVYSTSFNGRDYRLVKTSNFRPIGEIKDLQQKVINDHYALYYGNYVYFDTTGASEEMIKCDTYEIRLYNEEWFKGIFTNAVVRYFKEDGNEDTNSTSKRKQSIMIVEIRSETTINELLKTNKDVYDSIKTEPTLAEHSALSKRISKNRTAIDNLTEVQAIKETYDKLLQIKTLIEDHRTKEAINAYKKIL